MRLLVAALLSAALIGLAPQATPVNNLQSKVVRTETSGQAPRESEHPDTPVPPAETQAAPKPPTEPEPAPVETPTPAPAPVPTGKEEMMAAAGIAPSDYAAVDYIVSHESTWNASAVNPSSGSCGLIQELPCGKSGCTFGDGVCQLRWATNYAVSRYGSWWSAQSFWAASRWW